MNSHNNSNMPLFNNKNKHTTAAHQNMAATGGVPGSTTAAPVAGNTAATGAGHIHPTSGHLPGPAPYTAGPHKHDIMNKLDPTVDSQSGGMQVTAPGTQASGVPGQAPLHTNHAVAAGGMGGQVPVQQGHALGSNNPWGVEHNSHLANTVDPRVDSTRANNMGNYTTVASGGASGGASGMPTGVEVAGTAAAPRNIPEGTYGTHNSRLANAADPRIDSDADHRARVGMGNANQTASQFPPGVAGPAPTTAGPHRHDIMNKLDPSVDSRPAGVRIGGVNGTGRRLA